jgi:hypothetical protein
MGELARHEDRERAAERRAQVGPAPAPAGAPARTAGPAPSAALALQRAVGNRAAGRVLARWAAHPDKDKKGVLMPDAMAAEFLRFNPPLSK